MGMGCEFQFFLVVFFSERTIVFRHRYRGAFVPLLRGLFYPKRLVNTCIIKEIKSHTGNVELHDSGLWSANLIRDTTWWTYLEERCYLSPTPVCSSASKRGDSLLARLCGQHEQTRK